MNSVSSHSNQSTAQVWSEFDHAMMARAIQLAKKGKYTARPNPNVGCVIVKQQKIIGEGWHEKSGKAHAEINALKQAGSDVKDATCYVTLEPCSHTGKTGPCVDALIAAGIKRVVAAMQDPHSKVSGKGFAKLKQAGITVECGLMQTQAEALNKGFISRMVRQRPWVTCKMAISVDGRTALENGQSQWITGKAARADVQKLRAQQDAIITGIGTLLADNPSMTVRKADTDNAEWFEVAQRYGFVQPKRILLDRNDRADSTAKFFNSYNENDTAKNTSNSEDHVEVIWVNKAKNKDVPNHIKLMDYPESLQILLENLAQLDIGNLLLECGAELAGAFLKAQLIDEIIIYMAPKLMGDKSKGIFNFSLDNLSDATELKLVDCRQVGQDIRLTYRMKNENEE